MPERIFKYFTTAELTAAVKELGLACANPSGATTALRNSNTGWLREAAALTGPDLKSRYRDARYEIYLRGQGLDAGISASEIATCLALEPANPLREKVMVATTVTL